jgi:DNA-binding beta-propeller fold protein YncE
VQETPDPEASALRWRLTSAADDDLPFTTVTGLDATATLLLVADAYGGIYGFDMEGALALLASPGEIGYVSDVAAGPDGRLYMADSALHQVTMFDAEGSLLGAFGGLGSGDGEFGGDSPRALAIGPTGEVFVLDPNADAAGAPLLRVQVFGPEGDFLRSFGLDPAWDIRGIDVGPDETLFVVGPGGFLGELEPEEGRLIQQLGREVLGARSPQAVAVDDAGYLHLATQVPAAVAVLSPLGDLVGWVGEEGVRTAEGWDEGTFLFPTTVAVTPDGGVVFVGDMYPPFVYVTALAVGD